MTATPKQTVNATIDIREAGAIRRRYKRQVSAALDKTMVKAESAKLSGRQRTGATHRRIREAMAKHLGPALITRVEKDFIVIAEDPGLKPRMRFAVAGVFSDGNYGFRNERITCSDHIVDRVIQDAGMREVDRISHALWERLGPCTLLHLQGRLPAGKSLVVDFFGYCVVRHANNLNHTDLITWVPRSSWDHVREAGWKDRIDSGETIIEAAEADD